MSRLKAVRIPDESELECIDLDVAAFDKALELAMAQLEELQSNADESLSDVAGMIFTAHFLMLRDENFSGKMRDMNPARGQTRRCGKEDSLRLC